MSAGCAVVQVSELRQSGLVQGTQCTQCPAPLLTCSPTPTLCLAPAWL